MLSSTVGSVSSVMSRNHLECSIPVGRPWQWLQSMYWRYLCHQSLIVTSLFCKIISRSGWKMPDQTAARIVTAVTSIVCSLIPELLHSDQGRNFESLLLRETLRAFGTNKSHTTAYHPQGNGMVERFNWSLLQMLQLYVQVKHEQYLELYCMH